jgi:hypothetical protein
MWNVWEKCVEPTPVYTKSMLLIPGRLLANHPLACMHNAMCQNEAEGQASICPLTLQNTRCS